MRALLRSNKLPTAVICSNDMTAIGVLHAAAEARLRIPEDISVIGFDDIHIARFTIPPLTTIRMSCQELAHAAFQSLRAYLETNGKHWQENSDVRTKLKVRQSTSTPRKAAFPATLSKLSPKVSPFSSAKQTSNLR